MRRSLCFKIVILSLAIAVLGIGIWLFVGSRNELRTVSSESKLYRIYNNVSAYYEDGDNPFTRLFLLPFSFDRHDDFFRVGTTTPSRSIYNSSIPQSDLATIGGMSESSTSVKVQSSDTVNANTKSKDFSQTNIQVENVDEADIVKTDGDYIYSISGDEVLISDVRDSANPKIITRIAATNNATPEDLILTEKTLTIIGTEQINYGSSGYDNIRYSSDYKNTDVRIYDISDRSNPSLEKSYKLYQPYYTSRRIGNQLYVIAAGEMRKKKNEKLIEHSYYEDFSEKEFSLDSIYYLKDNLADDLTVIASLNLDNLDAEIQLGAFLLDAENIYASEEALYVAGEKYEDLGIWSTLKHLFGWGGVPGFIAEENSEKNKYDNRTTLYKFSLTESEGVKYLARAKIKGGTINQYSMDERAGHLRVALQDKDGSYVAIFDEKMHQLGESGRVGKGENMKASRFIGDKVYLITYKNTDPLFVIDLANEANPVVLGELKIPGYSVYLHPYDENHLIGIGVDTEESIYKDVNGRILSSSAYLTGMKIALFDISNFKNPKEVSKLHIGDARTSSAILTNPKALLFSKEKHLLAIPVNNYIGDDEYDDNGIDDEWFKRVQSYYGQSKARVGEGYIIYDINTESGITERGQIIHKDSALIRGVYIEDDLVTVSEKILRINDLNTLAQKAELKLTKE